jgi:hypothetical protein
MWQLKCEDTKRQIWKGFHIFENIFHNRIVTQKNDLWNLKMGPIANLLYIIMVKEIYEPTDNSIQHSSKIALCIMLQLPWNTINP